VSAALVAAPPRTGSVVIKPAPLREPPFDDELPDARPLYGPFDRRLPFDAVPLRPVWKPAPPRPSELPAPGPWARRLLIGMIETAAGRRPLHQLTPLLSPSVTRGIGADFERAAQAGTPHWLHRASVRSVRASEPARGVSELCATVDTGGRIRAIAMRLEEHHGRWRCTRLQLG
jgi:Family of unknown function (DUF6459)